MGRLCSVLICDSRVNKSNNENATLFSIPKDDSICKSWTNIVKNWNGNNQNVSYLCHKHFRDEEIIKTFEGQSSNSNQVNKKIITEIFKFRKFLVMLIN